jgi:hypothetical protein
MPTGMFEYRDEGERRAIERAIAFVAEMRDLAQTAPNGQVLGLCEAQALGQGRDLLRATLQEAVQARVEAAEAKRGGAAVRVRGPAAPQAALRPGAVDGHRADPAVPLAWPL